MTITARYGGRCGRCGEWFEAGTAILWERGTAATHATLAACEAAKVAADAKRSAPKVVVSLEGLVAFLDGAKQRGLKYPKARFLAPGGGELRLSVAGEQSRFPGCIQVVVRDTWIGRVRPDGSVDGQLKTDTRVLETLRAIALDPVTAAKAYGALMCRCSFCDAALTDAGSVEVGYGPVCAKHWGLPHHPKGTPTLAPVGAAAPVDTSVPLGTRLIEL